MIARVGRRIPLAVRTMIRAVRTANDEQVYRVGTRPAHQQGSVGNDSRSAALGSVA